MSERQFAIAQLRHAYALLKAGHVRDLNEFADGLIGPQIERLERPEPDAFTRWATNLMDQDESQEPHI